MSGAVVGTPAVTVIVPIFNQERYLSKCLDSLLAQTLTDIEIIGVDDGSTDRSGEILDLYAASHERVRALHRENGGLGPARNMGLDVARGRYVGFVDSDDWVHENMYERLYELAESSSADIAVGGHEEWTDGKIAATLIHPLAGNVLVGQAKVESCREQFYGRAPHDNETIPYPVSVWSQLYRKDTIESIKARFHEILSEDVFFNLDVYKAANKVVFSGDCGYCYRKDMQESITRTFTAGKTERYINFYELLGRYAGSETESGEALMRARRKMVDYSRSYVFMVEKSGIAARDKAEAVGKLVDSDAFKTYCANYPLDGLPRFQSAFHTLLVHKRFHAACALVRVRMILRGER